MSRENVESAKRLIEASSARDYGTVAAYARWGHLIRFRGDKVVRVETYGHVSSAPDAAGPSQ